MSRGRKPNIDPSRPIQIKMAETLLARVTLHLFSQVDGQIPRGKIKEFFEARVREYFEWRRLDLGPYGFPPGYFVAGPQAVIEAVERRIKETER